MSTANGTSQVSQVSTSITPAVSTPNHATAAARPTPSDRTPLPSSLGRSTTQRQGQRSRRTSSHGTNNTTITPITGTKRPAPLSATTDTKTTAVGSSFLVPSSQSNPLQFGTGSEGQYASCKGVYDGYFGAALIMAGLTMLDTGRQLMKWAAEGDAGIKSFSASVLSGNQMNCFCRSVI